MDTTTKESIKNNVDALVFIIGEIYGYLNKGSTSWVECKNFASEKVDVARRIQKTIKEDLEKQSFSTVPALTTCPSIIASGGIVDLLPASPMPPPQRLINITDEDLQMLQKLKTLFTS
jgi:hypothetical protein